MIKEEVVGAIPSIGISEIRVADTGLRTDNFDTGVRKENGRSVVCISCPNGKIIFVDVTDNL